mmetsp:Transcript_80773/g.130933  ORF Transcript_80773/g.130933 Transcript_80773/m.130933 type:complete len:95 (+) Transcript_80773:674-958(+)
MGSSSNVCACNAGTTGSDGFATCALCDFGTHKPEVGSAPCNMCGTGKSSTVMGSISNVCTCNVGTTGPDGFATCSLCGTGTYKTQAGSASCTVC